MRKFELTDNRFCVGDFLCGIIPNTFNLPMSRIENLETVRIFATEIELDNRWINHLLEINIIKEV